MVNWPLQFRKAAHDAVSMTNLGLLYQDAGQPDQAMATYLEAIRTEPTYQDSYLALEKMRYDQTLYYAADGQKKLKNALSEAAGLLNVAKKQATETLELP